MDWPPYGRRKSSERGAQTGQSAEAAVACVVQNTYELLAAIRLLRQVLQAAACSSKPVTACGELAGDISTMAMLLGLGVRRFSVSQVDYRLEGDRSRIRQDVYPRVMVNHERLSTSTALIGYSGLCITLLS